jgi:hypothetical protein
MPKPKEIVCHAGSLVWAVQRVVNDAVEQGRLSPTEAAVVLDFTCHSELPQLFREHPYDGGFVSEPMF